MKDTKTRTHELKSLAGAIALALCSPFAAADMPATPHQAAVVADGDAEVGKQIWADTLLRMPVTTHQRSVLDDFVAADANADGWLTPAEYEHLSRARASHIAGVALHATTKGPGIEVAPRDNLTAYAMLGLDEQFATADRDGDRKLGFHEVYVFETFDRPGVFPTASEAIPQEVSGHWEMQTVGEHRAVYHQAPFSPEKHAQAIEEGGFVAVDDNDDGVVSIFEASDFSLLTWTAAVHAFAEADVDNDALLGAAEYETFIEAIAEAPQQAERPGDFPSGRQ